MSTYLSSLLTTTQRFRQLLPAGESDGDTTDDTHICRVLRAYYTEKGRAFPSWLPPDPKSAPAASLPGNNYGGGGNYGGMGMGGGGGGVGGQSKLSSLWDPKPAEQAPQQPSMSLRQPRTMGGAQGGNASLGRQSPAAPALQQIPSAGERLKSKWARSGGSSPAPGAQSSSRPAGNDRQQSYESGGRDRLDTGRPRANEPWASGGGDPYASDPRRQQGGQRGYR